MPETAIINSANTGIKKLVYAIMTDETLETYSTVKSAPPVINIKVAPKVDVANLYGNDQTVETATALGDIPVDYEVQDMPLEIQADFLGHTLDPTLGTLTYNVNDVAPYIALGYQRTKGNGKSRYVWLFKVKFQEIDEDIKTKEDKVSFQTPKVTGLAIANKKGDWKKAADDDTKGTPVVDFLASVPGTVVDLVAPTVITVPLDSATGVLATANIITTFSKTISPSTITAENVFVMKTDGTAVPTTLSMDATNTILTIHPITSMDAGTYLAVMTTSIKSLTGVALATNCIVNFTV